MSLTIGIVNTFFVSVIFTLLYLPQLNAWKCPVAETVTLVPDGSYKPKGKIVDFNGMDIYETGDPSSKNLLIGIHDIYGINGNTNSMEISDIFAEGGNRVILPDFFQRKPWSLAKMHPVAEKEPDFAALLESHSWEAYVRDELKNILDHYKTSGFTNLGIFGFSYGGHKVMRASNEFANEFKVALQFTPAPVFQNDVNLIKLPTFLVSSKLYSPNFTEKEFCNIIEKNIGDGSCVYLVYSDMEPGFLGAEGNWKDDIVRAKAEEAIGEAQKFLCNKFFT